MRSIIEAQPTHLPIMVSEAEAARLLDIGESTLAKERKAGRGPKYKQIGDRIVYSVDALREWANQ